MSGHVNRLFRALHTLKGNARIFKLGAVQDVAHAAEESLSRARESGYALEAPQIAELGAQIAEVRRTVEAFKALAQQLFKRAVDGGPASTGAVLKIPEPRVLQLRQSFKTVSREVDQANGRVPHELREKFELLGRHVQELTMVRLQDVMAPLRKMALNLAREQGKAVADVDIVGDDVLLDARLLGDIKEILLHALRNAVDHGLEAPAQRRAANKPQAGRIVLRIERSGPHS